MSETRNPDHTPETNEPDYIPNQAEGTAGEEGMNEHLRTPGQAEGERRDVEETLQQERPQSTTPTQESKRVEEAESGKGILDRIKNALGLG